MSLGDDKRRSVRVYERRVLVSFAVFATLLAWPAVAQAQAQPACDSSAVDQYVECIPTSGGDDASAGTGADPTRTLLPPSLVGQIRSQGGEDASLLEEVASSSRYGAPQKSLGQGGSGLNGKLRLGKEQVTGTDASTGEALGAVVSAVQGGDAGRLVGLLVALFLVSLAAVGAAAVRQKRRSAV